jgi:biopolymer transport protein ExbD
MLLTALRAVVAHDRNAKLLINADKDVAYARVMFVIDTAKKAGLTSIALGTDSTP